MHGARNRLKKVGVFSQKELAEIFFAVAERSGADRNFFSRSLAKLSRQLRYLRYLRYSRDLFYIEKGLFSTKRPYFTQKRDLFYTEIGQLNSCS